MKMYFKCVRQPNGGFSDWEAIDGLPEEWPQGATTALYPHSGNRIYNVPGDSVRYYEMLDGASCFNCGTLIDKSVQLHAEDRIDRDKCLCSSCWSGINHGEIELPQLIDNKPIYRLKNSVLDIQSSL